MKRAIAAIALACCLVGAPNSAEAQTILPGFERLKLSGHLMSWTKPKSGPLVIRYAFVNGPRRDPKARNCKAMVPLDAMAKKTAIPLDVLKQRIIAGLSQWSRHVDVSFVEVAPSSKTDRQVDLWIGAMGEPRRIAWADVIPSTETNEPGRIARTNICFNPLILWKTALGGSPLAYDISYVSAHEAGHVLGLDHAGAEGNLMSFGYSEEKNRLSYGDIRGAQLIYGPARSALQQNQDVFAITENQKTNGTRVGASALNNQRQ